MDLATGGQAPAAASALRRHGGLDAAHHSQGGGADLRRRRERRRGNEDPLHPVRAVRAGHLLPHRRLGSLLPLADANDRVEVPGRQPHRHPTGSDYSERRRCPRPDAPGAGSDRRRRGLRPAAALPIPVRGTGRSDDRLGQRARAMPRSGGPSTHWAGRGPLGAGACPASSPSCSPRYGQARSCSCTSAPTRRMDPLWTPTRCRRSSASSGPAATRSSRWRSTSGREVPRPRPMRPWSNGLPAARASTAVASSCIQTRRSRPIWPTDPGRPKCREVHWRDETRGGTGLAERMVVRALYAPAGDFRDWPAVRAWAAEIAAVLQPKAAGIPAG